MKEYEVTLFTKHKLIIDSINLYNRRVNLYERQATHLEEVKAHGKLLLFVGFMPLEICEVIHILLFFKKIKRLTIRQYIVTHAFIN